MVFTKYYNLNPEVVKTEGFLDIDLDADFPFFVDITLMRQHLPEWHDKSLMIMDTLIIASRENPQMIRNLGLHEMKYNRLGYGVDNFNGKFGVSRIDNALTKTAQALSMIEHGSFKSLRLHSLSPLKFFDLFGEGIGKDTVSDLYVLTILDLLAEYTQSVAQKYLGESQIQDFKLRVFNDQAEVVNHTYQLPVYKGKPVILTPRQILVADKEYLSENMMLDSVYETIEGFTKPNSRVRAELVQTYQQYVEDVMKEEDGKNVTRSRERKAAKRLFHLKPHLVVEFLVMKDDFGIYDEVEKDKGAVIEAMKSFVAELPAIKEPNHVSSSKDAVLWLSQNIKETFLQDELFGKYVEPLLEVTKSRSRLIEKCAFLLIKSILQSSEKKLTFKRGAAHWEIARAKVKFTIKHCRNNGLSRMFKHLKEKKRLALVLYESVEDRQRVEKLAESRDLKIGQDVFLIKVTNENNNAQN